MSFTMRPGWGLLIVLLLIAIPVCGHIDHMPILQWDEARLANNALEMYHNGNWMVTYFDGSPDMWNTKPPLMIWLQVLSMHILGINELAVRFPSVAAAVTTCLMLYWLLGYKLRKPLLGIITVLVLITSEGFVRYHVARTGDYDALLVLFTTAMGIFFFLFLEEGRMRYLYFFFTALTLAFLTKGIPPTFIFLPPMLLYAGWRRKLPLLLKSKHSYVGFLVFLMIAGGYYLLREHYNPGYLKAVLYNDVTGRYLHTDMDNGDDAAYYLRAITDESFRCWYLLIIPGLIIGAGLRDERLRRLTAFGGALAIFQFLIISMAQTKNGWYDASIYPFLAIVVGQLVFTVCALLHQYQQTGGLLRWNLLPYALLLLIFTLPYSAAVNRSINPHYPGSWEDESIGFYLKELYHDKTAQLDASLIRNDNSAEIKWYLSVLRETNRAVMISDQTKLKAGDKVIVYGNDTRHYLDTTYKTHLIRNDRALAFIQIDSLRMR